MEKCETVGRKGELLVEKKFKELGLDYEAFNQKDYSHNFDYIVNGKVKIEVKASNLHKNQNYDCWFFCTTNNKDFDFLVCVGFEEGEEEIYMVIPENKITCKCGVNMIKGKSSWDKYIVYKDKWDSLWKRCGQL